MKRLRQTTTPTFAELEAPYAEYKKFEDAHDFYTVQGYGCIPVPKTAEDPLLYIKEKLEKLDAKT